MNIYFKVIPIKKSFKVTLKKPQGKKEEANVTQSKAIYFIPVLCQAQWQTAGS